MHLDGYVNVDIVPSPATDLTADITRLPMFGDNSVEEIRMDAVLEHLYRHMRRAALAEWRRVLRPGGQLTIRFIPDFDTIADHYVHKKPGILHNPFSLDEVYLYTHGDPVPVNASEQIHKDIFSRESVERELKKMGFEITAIENVCYSDEPIALNLNVQAIKPAEPS